MPVKYSNIVAVIIYISYRDKLKLWSTSSTMTSSNEKKTTVTNTLPIYQFIAIVFNIFFFRENHLVNHRLYNLIV